MESDIGFFGLPTADLKTRVGTISHRPSHHSTGRAKTDRPESKDKLDGKPRGCNVQVKKSDLHKGSKSNYGSDDESIDSEEDASLSKLFTSKRIKVDGHVNKTLMVPQKEQRFKVRDGTILRMQEKKAPKRNPKQPQKQKQLGIHFFLSKSTSTSSTSNEKVRFITSTATPSSSTSSGHLTTTNKGTRTKSNFSYGERNDIFDSTKKASAKKRPLSFTSAASLLKNEKKCQYFHVQDNERGCLLERSLTDSGNNESLNVDDISNFDDENDSKSSDTTMSCEENNDKGIGKDSCPTDNGNSPKKTIETDEPDRKESNRKLFGISSIIIGRTFPQMELNEKHHAYFTSTLPPTLQSPHISRESHNSQQARNEELLRGRGGINILSQLFQRSYISSTPSNYCKMNRYLHSGCHWNVSETVELSCSSSNVNGENINEGEVCAMSFDSEGILLASGDNRGVISIYDFDDLLASDLRKRNERSLSKREVELKSEEEIITSSNNDMRKSESGVENPRDVSTSESRLSSSLNILPCSQNETNDGNQQIKEDSAVASHPTSPAKINPLFSFQCLPTNARGVNQGNSLKGLRINSLQWNPWHQDQLAVSFVNYPEVFLYDVASSQLPLPCLRVGSSLNSSTNFSRSEGVLAMQFIHSSKIPPKRCASTFQLITGGSYGTVRLWTILKPWLKQKEERPLDNMNNGKCTWSISAFGSKSEEGVCDIAVLPRSTPSNVKESYSKTTAQKPLVFIAGSASSLVLLDTNRCNRKAFSTEITPKILGTWDLYSVALQQLAKIDPTSKVPARRWMAVQRITLFNNGCNNGLAWYKLGLVVKCGWVFIADLSILHSSSTSKSELPSISFRSSIIHRTCRVRCFNSFNEHVSNLGGMALRYSLPDVPVPSTGTSSMLDDFIWVGEVKARLYTMPSRDKFTLFRDNAEVSTSSDLSLNDSSPSSSLSRQSGGGLILIHLNDFAQYIISSDESSGNTKEDVAAFRAGGYRTQNVVARLPLARGVPVTMMVHPSGEWMVVGFGKTGRGEFTRSLELISMRKT